MAPTGAQSARRWRNTYSILSKDNNKEGFPMAEYRKSEAREWAKAEMRGVANIIIPTFAQDLRGLNERAIRHDVRKEIEYGFWGALLVAETATTLPEYSQFATWAADEAKGKLHLIHHASFNTLEEN